MEKKSKFIKVLVTGGAGYIGSVLVDKLVNEGYLVTIVDTFYWGDRHLNQHRGRIRKIKADIRKTSSDIFIGQDAVIHLAALSNDPMAEFSPKANFEINTHATVRLAALAKKTGIKRFIFSSSASIYHRDNIQIETELTETAKVKPILPYSSSKFLAEKALLKSADKNFCPVVLRLGTVYGFSPRMRYDLVVNTMLKTALKERKLIVFCGGKQWRPLVAVDDVAEAFIRCLSLENKLVCGEIFNVFNQNYQVLDLAKSVKKALQQREGIKVEIIVSHDKRRDRSYRISNKKLINVFGWQPMISVEEAIVDMLKQINSYHYIDFNNPRYYNIEWMKKRIKL